MAQVGEVCVDRYEAYLLIRASDGSLEPNPPYARPPEGAEYVARAAAGVFPQAYISRIEAERACNNAGKRLCSLTEWYRACRGVPPTPFPYGPRFEAERCNVGKPHLLSRLHGDNPQRWRYEEDFNDPALIREPGFLMRAGELAGCVSSFGVHDMVGNLHEWVADRVDASLALKLPLEAGIRRRLHANRGKGVFMGGFFSTMNQHGRGCAFVTIAHEAKYHDYSTGFRCCRDP